MRIEVTFVLTDIYKDRPKIGQVPKMPILRALRCAHWLFQAGKNGPRSFDKSLVFKINGAKDECKVAV
jgi:hypothetical protein